MSNYPGTTVEITRGRTRLGDQVWEIVDTPGTHNLVPMSEDEAVTRDILVSSPHDALVQVGDAKNLIRTLLLSLQIAELGIPFCLDLNMLDEARARGLSIDLEALERELGVRVNASTATEGEGLDAVRGYLVTSPVASTLVSDTRPAPEPLSCAPRFPDEIEAAIADISAHLDGSLPVAKRALATMLLAGERGVGGTLASVAHVGPEAVRIAKERALTLAHARRAHVRAAQSAAFGAARRPSFAWFSGEPCRPNRAATPVKSGGRNRSLSPAPLRWSRPWSTTARSRAPRCRRPRIR